MFAVDTETTFHKMFPADTYIHQPSPSKAASIILDNVEERLGFAGTVGTKERIELNSQDLGFLAEYFNTTSALNVYNSYYDMGDDMATMIVHYNTYSTN